MFTGIIESIGSVTRCDEAPAGRRLVVDAGGLARESNIGDSVAVSGVCLTVVEIDGTRFSFDVGEETLRRSTLGELQPGGGVNLELSLKVGDRLGGHFIYGHVDGAGRLIRRDDAGEFSMFYFACPPELTRQMVVKGSIAVDGVSLTLVEVGAGGFCIMLIPHTLEVTTLGRLPAGGSVNLETDMLAKYVEKQLQP